MHRVMDGLCKRSRRDDLIGLLVYRSYFWWQTRYCRIKIVQAYDDHVIRLVSVKAVVSMVTVAYSDAEHS